MFSARLHGHGVAARWLRGLGVAAPHHLASLFRQSDLDDGITLVRLGDEMGVDDGEELVMAERDLYELIDYAREESAAANAAAARKPPWVYNSRRLATERADRRTETNKVITKGKCDVKQPRPPAPAKARYGTRGRRLAESGRPHARAEAEAAERDRWVNEIVAELRSLGAPSWRRLEGSLDAVKLMRLQIGGRRASTLRARLREWRKYRTWLRALKQVDYPTKVTDLVDYLVDRAEEPCTKSTLMAFRASLRFMENIGGFGTGWTEDEIFRNCYGELVARATERSDGEPSQRAIPPTAKMMAMMEAMVVNDTEGSYDAMLAWWGLLSAWAVLRFDDHRGLSPADVVEHDTHWELTLRRTKTTGADKGVAIRVSVVSKTAWFRHAAWISLGWARWVAAAPHPRDYFLSPPGVDGRCAMSETTYVEYAARMRAMLGILTDHVSGDQLGMDAAMVYSPHSYRSFLTSSLSASGASEDQLGWLMAWKTKGAMTYVRTGRTQTLDLQAGLAGLVREKWGKADPIGESDVLEMGRVLARRRGTDEGEIMRTIDFLATFAPKEEDGRTLNFGITTVEGFNVDVEGAVETEGGVTVADAASSSTSAPSGNKGDKASPSPKEGHPAEGYVVSHSRKRGIRCLHLVGRCYRKPGSHYLMYDARGPNLPPTEDYDQICGSCWPDGFVPLDIGSQDESASSSTDSESGAGQDS